LPLNKGERNLSDSPFVSGFVSGLPPVERRVRTERGSDARVQVLVAERFRQVALHAGS